VTLLLDEQLDTHDGAVAKALNAMENYLGLSFSALRLESPGLTDEEIPNHCRKRGHDALVSFNHRDFGKKLPLYEALLQAGISIVVLRPPKQVAFSPERQLALISHHARCIRKHLTAAALTGPVLIRLSPTECRQRSITEITAEARTGRSPVKRKTKTK
jgi:hypothetical protein